jgi:DNA-directed RNA polymerase beta subunit
MKISNITQNRITSSKIVIDEPTVFLTFPDPTLPIWEVIYNTNFILSNCEAIISPGNMVKFLRKSFNAKVHALEFKKKIIELEQSSKKLKVVNNLKLKDADSRSAKFYFYDMGVYSKAIQEFEGKFVPKKLAEELFIASGKIYKTIKDNYPSYNVEMLFLMKNDKGFLWKMFDNLKQFVPINKLNETNFFDKFCYVSINKRLIPVIEREKGKSSYLVKNMTRIPKYVEEENISSEEQIIEPEIRSQVPDTIEPAVKSQETSMITPPQSTSTSTSTSNKESDEHSTGVKGVVKGLSKELKIVTNIDKDGEIKVEINTPQLKKILANYDIKDQVILSNVKVAIDKHLTNNRESKEKMTREQAEVLVLKAVNKTIHGTDELRETYRNDPKLLFDKLKKIDNYNTPLNFPKYQNEMIQPKNIIDLDYTSGQNRQKHEFDTVVHQNVEKLFRILEDFPDYPVKIKKFSHEIIDTDSDRLIQYTVTLQNTSGGYSKPYEIKLNIPGLVSERYFKIKGSHYIQASQQFLNPLTKTNPNDVRLLSNYAITSIHLVNFKFNLANIKEYLNYIKIKYPKFIKEETEDYVIFFNGDKIGLTGNLVYSNADGSKKVEIDPDTNKLIDLAGRSRLGITKYEYQLEYLFDKLKDINSSETLNKTKLKIPYLEIYLGGLKLPLILYLWSQKGLLITLNDESIDYNITDGKVDDKSSFSIKTNKTQYLNIFPKGFRQTCMVNGLLKLQTILNDRNIKDLNNPESCYDLITEYTGASGSIKMITLMTKNEIDPITKDLLEFDGHSTTLVKLVSKDMLDMLFDQQPSNLADLSIYRARLSEMIFQYLYNQITQAHNHYRNKVFGYDDQDAKVEINETYIVQNLITNSGVLQNDEPFSPVQEIALASRVIKSGKGGVPSKFSFKTSHRNIHPSNYGNISAASTSESADVGLVSYHTLTPSIINQYGNYGIKDIKSLKPWQILSLDEALTPMQNSMDGDRLVMARTHATQIVPVENSEIPLVMTGAEHLTGQLASTRFIQRAKYGGKIVEVIPNKYMSVKYDNNIIENLDIVPRISRTKRGSFIQLEMDTMKAGDLFKKNDTLAWTKNFKNGVYTSGKNVVVCFMNYMGFCHEDSYVVTEDLANKVERTVVKKVEIVIPPNAKVLNLLEKKDIQVSSTDILLEFTHDFDLESYIQSQGENFDEEDLEKLLLSQSENSVKLLAGLSGELIGLKIFLNTKKEMDLKLINLHTKMVAEDRKTIKMLGENQTKDGKLSSFDNVQTDYFKIGNHKLKGGKEFLGAHIVFYIKEKHPLMLGDKICNRYGSKGVISKMIDKDQEPYSEVTDLKPEVFISPISIFGRKNIPFLKEIYLGKIFHFLQEQCAEMAATPKISTSKIIKKILGVYELLAAEKIYKDVENLLNKSSQIKLRADIKSKKLQLRLIIEPFTNVSMSRIKQAAELIDIPLDEKVYIPELDTYTDVPVPVGIGYYQFMEHISEDFANIRGADSYTSLTRQPTKGKQKGGGQAIGGLDIYALISLNADKCLQELLTVRSDDHIRKREVYLNILNNGELVNMPKETGEGGTKTQFDLYIKSMGLEIT